MASRKLTKSVVDSLESREDDYVQWCGALPGFGCRVRPTGTKSFIAQYRMGGRKGPTRKVTIGKYERLTVEQARDEAKRILAKAELGRDEADERAKARAELTVSELCDEYLERGCRHKKPSTIATDKGRIERHIKPLLGKRRIGTVEGRHIRNFQANVEDGKTAITELKENGKIKANVRGGAGTARRTVRLLGGIFSYAVEQGYIESNPRLGVKIGSDSKGQRFLSSDELKRLGEALREAETIGLPWTFNEGANAKHRPVKDENRREVLSPYALAAIRLLLLTGCRAGEILSLQWEHVDLERGILNLPDSKTGAKPIILGAPAMAVLAELPRVKGNPYVIVGEKEGQPRSDLKRPWKRVTARAGLEGVRLHDLRHTFASMGAMSGMGLPIVGKLLGHASPATTARYAHLADDPLRRASDAISSGIAAQLADSSGEVVPLRKAGDAKAS